MYVGYSSSCVVRGNTTVSPSGDALPAVSRAGVYMYMYLYCRRFIEQEEDDAGDMPWGLTKQVRGA